MESPQTNGIVERLHKTMLDEFYRIAFRKKLYLSIEAPQDDLDEWIRPSLRFGYSSLAVRANLKPRREARFFIAFSRGKLAVLQAFRCVPAKVRRKVRGTAY